MAGSFLNDFSKALIQEVEDECAANDPDEIGDAAAMVLVGDVYAVQVCRSEGAPPKGGQGEPAAPEESVAPFIR